MRYRRKYHRREAESTMNNEDAAQLLDLIQQAEAMLWDLVGEKEINLYDHWADAAEGLGTAAQVVRDYGYRRGR